MCWSTLLPVCMPVSTYILVPRHDGLSFDQGLTRPLLVYVDCQFTYLEINPLVVIPNAEGTSADVHFLDLAAKLDQTADFECGAKWAIAAVACQSWHHCCFVGWRQG